MSKKTGMEELSRLGVEIALCFKPYLSREETARFLDVSTGTVDKMRLPCSPLYPGSRVYVYSRKDIDAHLERTKIGGEGTGPEFRP